MKMDKRIFLYHVLGWAAFSAYEVLVLYFISGGLSPAPDYITHYILNAVLFYFNAALINKGYRHLLTVIFVGAEVMVYMVINYYLNSFLEWFGIHLTRPSHPMGSFFVASFWRCIYFIGLSSGYGIAIKLIRAQRRMGVMMNLEMQKENDKVVLEKKLLTTQNALLRAQINPHLFFNTLNFIYNSVRKLSYNAGEAVQLLADITRYSITTGDSDGLVLLSDELVNVKDLIALNQIRYDENLYVNFEMDGNFDQFKIIPLILLTLVENVFKYGELQDEHHPAIIYIEVLDEVIHFGTRNKKTAGSQNLRRGGIGVENALFRLQHAYGDNFSLLINGNSESFSVDLTINIECLCAVVLS